MIYMVMRYTIRAEPAPIKDAQGVVREFKDRREAEMVADYMNGLAKVDRSPDSYGVMAR